MWENILVTGLILHLGCNNTLLSEGHNKVSFQKNTWSNTLYKNKLHLWIWMTTFGRSTKSWSLPSPQLHQQDKKHSERMILCKLRRMPLGTGQRNLTKALPRVKAKSAEAQCDKSALLLLMRQIKSTSAAFISFFKALWAELQWEILWQYFFN